MGSVGALSWESEDMYVPVDGDHDAILGKRRSNVVPPYRGSRLVALVRALEGVVDGGDDEDDVGDEGADAVDDELPGGEFLTAECCSSVRCVLSPESGGKSIQKGMLTARSSRSASVFSHCGKEESSRSYLG